MLLWQSGMTPYDAGYLTGQLLVPCCCLSFGLIAMALGVGGIVWLVMREQRARPAAPPAPPPAPLGEPYTSRPLGGAKNDPPQGPPA
jgi:hypothetical protein